MWYAFFPMLKIQISTILNVYYSYSEGNLFIYSTYRVHTTTTDTTRPNMQQQCTQQMVHMCGGGAYLLLPRIT